ncbi:MAG TPA: response regulator [Balneolales bacterium]|nr:response regulator [Balneolales bacterium]
MESMMSNIPNILIVDDDPRMCESLKVLLSSQDYELKTSNSVKEAIECLDNYAFDLVLLDIVMGEENGFTVMDHIISQKLDILVVMITGHTSPERAIEALRKGAYDFLKKPFEPEELLTTMRNALNQRIQEKSNHLLDRKLQVSEEKYRCMMESMKDAVYICSSEFRIEYMNPRMISRIGYDASGELCHKAIYDSDEKCSWCVFDRIQEGEHVDYELENPKDNRYYSITNSPIRHSGESISNLTIVRDITESKAIEAQLYQARKMGSIGTLAGGIAHDFNNILSGIMGYTELALDSVERKSQLYNYLQEVFRAGNRARDLVKQILTFSRQTGQNRKPIQVRHIVNEALKFLRASLPTSTEVRRNIQSDALVLADPTQIHQVLMNLCTNADHAMREKGGVLEVKLEEVELDADFTALQPDMKPGAYLNLTVSDTGNGMPPDVLERIFDPFFTTKETGEGTGMGLSVVHGIIGSYGGAITAYSEPGQGSTFKVYLPIIETSKEAHIGPEESIPIGSERILFVDDESVLVNMGKQIFESLGYDVTTRTSSIEALELFKNQPDRFDLVITDMTMPNMTGEDLAQELIRIKPNIPIILCTGFSAKIDDQKASAVGIRALVLKPIVKREIATTVRKVLD